uniref:Secreted protein n=1 Tax=Amblyomma variegatum TaxID=34610 RepID=F0JA44_AMBVA|nr:TPA_inf: hypothetical protein 384 [Amblyomma variegatum]
MNLQSAILLAALLNSQMDLYDTTADSRSDEEGNYDDDYSSGETEDSARNFGPLGLRVVHVAVNMTVTYATYGNNETCKESQFMGNWTRHSQCLMPCNTDYPQPCTSLTNATCICIPRNDVPSVGVCAVQGIPLGNSDYNETKACR